MGLAVGECLGIPLDGLTEEAILRRFGRLQEMIDPAEARKDDPGPKRVRGLHAFETQSAWNVLQLLMKEGQLVVEFLVKIHRSFGRPRGGMPHGIYRGASGPFHRFLASLLRPAEPLWKCGVANAHGAGLSRAIAAGVESPDDVTRAARHAVIACGLSHTDPRVIESAAALASLVSSLVGRSPPSDRDDMMEAALEGAAKGRELLKLEDPVRADPSRDKYIGDLRVALLEMRKFLHTDVEETLRQILRISFEMDPPVYLSGPTDAFAPSTFMSALAFASMAGSFEEAIVPAINLGGAASLVGAITGSLAGARFGARSIRPDWIQSLVARQYLEQLVDVLLKVPGRTLPEHEDMEEEWSSWERR